MVHFTKEKQSVESAMYLKEVKGRLFFYKRKPSGGWYCIPLGLYKNQKIQAVQKVGAILAVLEKGLEPISPKTKIKNLSLEGKITARVQQILDQHIYPFFGEFKPHEVDEAKISDYIVSRFGLDSDNELQAYENTLSKELQALQRLLQTVCGKNFKIDKPDYNKLSREILKPLTIKEIIYVSGFLNEKKYIPIYWFMVYTGMDIMDVVTLKPCDIKAGKRMSWIHRKRSKTQKEIKLPICKPLNDILSRLPKPLNPNQKIFPDINPKATSTYIRRVFDKAGLVGYGPKYLRRFVGSFLTDKGYSESWVGKALAHAEGSKQTEKYCQIYDSTMEEAFSLIEKEAINADNS